MPPDTPLHHARAAYFAWITVCLVWGTTYLAIRVALETIGPGLLGGLRYVIAGAILAAVVALRRIPFPAVAQWGGLALAGCLMIGIGNGAVIWAEQWVPSGIAAVVVASTPFWMTAIESVAPDGERVSPEIAAGLVIGFAGIVLLVWPDLASPGAEGRQFLLGIGALQIACVGWALGSSYSRRHARDENAWSASALQMIFGGGMMLAIGLARGEWTDLTFSGRSLAAEIYLIVAGSLAGYTAYVYALQHLPVSTVSLYAYVNPVIAVALGTVLLGEPFGWRVVAASAMVLAGITVVRREGRRRSRVRDTPP